MDIKQLILDILEVKGKPVKRKFLLALIQANDYDITDRGMRNVIAEMIEEGQLIQASEAGYSIIKSEKQLETAVRYLNSKAYALLQREAKLRQNWEKKKAVADPPHELFPHY